MAHGSVDETAEGEDHLLDDRPFLEFKAVAVDPAAELCQILSSSHSATFSLGSHWKYIRCTASVRWLIRAKPLAELA